MNRVAIRCPPCRLVDTDEKVTPRLLDLLATLNYAGVIRYVPLPGVSPVKDVDATELDLILSKGMVSCWVQHPRFASWKPREHDPEADARWAVKFARAAGYADLTHGYVDAEGMNEDTTWQEAHAYNSRFAHVVVEEGYSGGLYDGFSEPETPEELYEIPDVTSYWSDLANRKVAVRGTAMRQGPQFTLAGVPFDPDVVVSDQRGETPYVTRAQVATDAV